MKEKTDPNCYYVAYWVTNQGVYYFDEKGEQYNDITKAKQFKTIKSVKDWSIKHFHAYCVQIDKINKETNEKILIR
jgi:hypothetical protein